MSQTQEFRPEQKLTATLEAQDWNIVLAGLGELPMKIVRVVDVKLRQQLYANAPQPFIAPNGEERPRLPEAPKAF